LEQALDARRGFESLIKKHLGSRSACNFKLPLPMEMSQTQSDEGSTPLADLPNEIKDLWPFVDDHSAAAESWFAQVAGSAKRAKQEFPLEVKQKTGKFPDNASDCTSSAIGAGSDSSSRLSSSVTLSLPSDTPPIEDVDVLSAIPHIIEGSDVWKNLMKRAQYRGKVTKAFIDENGMLWMFMKTSEQTATLERMDFRPSTLSGEGVFDAFFSPTPPSGSSSPTGSAAARYEQCALICSPCFSSAGKRSQCILARGHSPMFRPTGEGTCRCMDHVNG
jgi:hypothetical protein